jgi:methionine-rich copper-binding protein CopC
MTRIFSFILISLLGLAPAYGFELTIVNQNAAAAQFQLVAAIPFDRQEVSPAPTAYILRFSQPVRPDRSSIKVLNSFGMRVNGEELQQPDGMSIATALPALAPGKYVVKWQARCQCPADLDLGETFHLVVK